ncbi:MAG: CRISPR-associated helicase Cas3' [Bacteroides sp.]|nr:CRISPR-associated helicase Cas3' [Eubacterium sp.]MCM1418931.1 CRISPR-associated helicase Cas3' [Roseburia sp.]MCM1462125.1 CRISPR-associated helicase Cas3' [Bacteroides sp.]
MFTAHVDKADKQRKQSVAEHTLGTAEKAARYAEKLGLSNTARLQGLLHDTGKLCGDFDAYINGVNDIRRGGIDHAFAGAKYLSEIASESDLSSVRTVAGYISRTVISHHGLHDWLYEDGKSYLDERVSKNERYDEILQNTSGLFSRAEIAELLERAASEYKKFHKKISLLSEGAQEFLFYGGLFERLLQSLLIDADRTDTADFMLGRTTEHVSDPKRVWETAEINLEKKYEGFAKKTDRISARRTKIADGCLNFAGRDVGVCRLIVPTGGGKTLSSLRFAVEHCRRTGKKRIFYIAPFMSILEQNSDIIKEIVGEENFLEHYSDFALSVDDKEELNEYELRAEKWDTPVVSTTLVQFLNTIYSSGIASVRRFHCLTDAVIIIDEVQAVPLKCVNLFNLAVNFLSEICGSTIVLCTATQPALGKTPFSVRFRDGAEMNPDYEEDLEVFRRVELISECRTSGYTYEEAAAFCAEKFEENGDLLVVVNTKSAAAKLYGLLKSRFENAAEILHLSTGMCPAHRRAALKRVCGELESKRPVICVTTQLIEAGVDISFRCVVRSLAGLDNAAQAAGRCNRNGEDPLRAAYIINLSEEKLGSLREIARRQSAAFSVIESGVFKELLGTSAMDRYFEKFYREQEETLSYPTEADGVKTTLVELLSLNGQRNSRGGRMEKSERIGTQSFKTAGNKFNVIDKDKVTEDIVVPYDHDARKLIDELNSELTPPETIEKLRRAKKYTISVYSNQLTRLAENHAVYRLSCGAFALSEQYYDSTGIGLKQQGGSLDVLIS